MVATWSCEIWETWSRPVEEWEKKREEREREKEEGCEF